jgi:hypothetical protein
MVDGVQPASAAHDRHHRPQENEEARRQRNDTASSPISTLGNWMASPQRTHPPISLDYRLWHRRPRAWALAPIPTTVIALLTRSRCVAFGDDYDISSRDRARDGRALVVDPCLFVRDEAGKISTGSVSPRHRRLTSPRPRSAARTDRATTPN